MCIRDRLKTEITKQDKKLREIDNKLEEQNKTIAGVKNELTIDINKIQINSTVEVMELSLIHI